MELKSMNCPNCGNPIKVDMTKKNYFCQYCGGQLLFDDGVQRVQHEMTGGFDFGYQEELGRQKAREEIEQKRLEEQQRMQAIRNQQAIQQKQEMMQQFLKQQKLAEKNRTKRQNTFLLAAIALWIGSMLIYWFLGKPTALRNADVPKARIIIGCLLALIADVVSIHFTNKAHKQNNGNNANVIGMTFDLIQKKQTGCITSAFQLILAVPIVAYVFTLIAALLHS